MADQNYRNLNPKSEDTRFKVNNNILRMMQANPALGIGYLIGNALGENYWGRKRAKTSQEAHDNTVNGYNIQRDSNGNVTSISAGSAPSSNSEWTARNAALDAYKNSDTGRNMYQGRSSAPSADNVPRTPQQSNTSGVTMNNNGGTRSVADAWRDMTNNSGYNPGNTTLFTNGVRDMGNVIPGGVAGPAIGADANGVYGVPGANPGVIVDTARGIYPGVAGTGSAPSADNIPRSPQTAAPNPNPTPIPYTPEQLQQIKDYGGFTPDELQRMGAGELNAPQTESSSGGSGLLGSVVNAAVNAATQPSTPAAPATFVPEEDAAAMDRRATFVPEEDAALAEGYRAANNFSRAAATPAGAANYSSRFITPGHDPSLEWHPFATQPTQSDLAAREMALKWLQENS